MNSSFVSPLPIHCVGLAQIPVFCRAWVILVGNNSIGLHNKAFGVADGFSPFPFLMSFWATKVQRQSLLRIENIRVLVNTEAHVLTPSHAEMQLLRTALAVFGKGCLSGSFSCLFLYTSELYPTVLR